MTERFRGGNEEWKLLSRVVVDDLSCEQIRKMDELN